MSTLFYCIKQGLVNMKRNLLFSIASIATVSACIFLFCMFYSIITNVQGVVHTAETTVGITVFFDEGADEAVKDAVRDAVLERGGVKDMIYTSAEEAWNDFKEDYFGADAAELSEAFADDNPLADEHRIIFRAGKRFVRRDRHAFVGDRVVERRAGRPLKVRRAVPFTE